MAVNVVFVCLGNICRSPMAEAVFAQLVKDAGLEEHIQADSCGTSGWHTGESPHQGTRQILQQKGVSYSHRARQLTYHDLEHAVSPPGNRLDSLVAEQAGVGGGNSQSAATCSQSFEMTLPEARSAVLQGQGLEKPIAVTEAAVGDR